MNNSTNAYRRSIERYCGKAACGRIDFFDVDIVGRGVLAAFITTVSLTILSIIIGYVFESVPGARTNSIDETLFQATRKVRRGRASEQKMKRRASTLESFVLSLSDQQLVTGMAILLAAFAQPCDVSVFSFRMATSMAWFSSTTHLATLGILHGYFEKRTWVKNCRTFGMVIFMVLLASAEFLTESARLHYTDNWDQSFACIITNNGTRPVHPGRSYQIFSVVVVTVWLVFAYANRLAALYSPDWKASRSWPYRAAARLLGLDPNPPAEAFTSRTLEGIRHSLGAQKRTMRLPRWLLISFHLIGPVQHELSNSFLYEIVWILFGLSFGITQVSQFLDSATKNRSGPDSFRGITGFGQLLPVLLLALPLLAIVEGFCDSRGTPDADNLPPQLHAGPAMQSPEAPSPKEDIEQQQLPHITSPPYHLPGSEREYTTLFDLPGSRTILLLETILWVGATQSFAVLAASRKWVNMYYVAPVYGCALVLWLWGTVWLESRELFRQWKDKRNLKRTQSEA